MRRLLSIVAVVVFLVGWMAMPATAQANQGPFTGEVAGEAQFVPANPMNCPAPPAGFGITTVTDATGPSSLGEVSIHFEHCPLADGTITRGAVTITVNGDVLHGTYTGTSTPPPPNLGELTFATLAMSFDGGTGRFANASGQAQLAAEIVFEGFEDLSWPWSATWEGTLSYGVDATLQFSAAADRSGAVDLHGATVTGKVFVFLEPLVPTGVEAINAVEFWVNGSLVHSECCAPYDMIGGTTDGPATEAWDSATVPDGETTITARIKYADGTSQDTTATFTVDNTTAIPAAWGLGYSTTADRADARPLLQGYAVGGPVYLFVLPLDPGISGAVDLYLDGELIRREYAAPYDLLGGSTGRADYALDTTTLADGVHNLMAIAVDSNQQAMVPFVVDNTPSDVEILETFPQPGPEGIATDAIGNLYLTFSGLGELRVLDPTGAWTTLTSWEVGEGLGPLGLELDGNDNVYVAVATFDPATHGVYRVSPEGAASRLPGSEAIGIPNDVTFDADGNLYVSDTLTGGVWRFAPGLPAEPWFVDPLLAGTGVAGFPFPIGANGIAYGDDTVHVVNTELSHLVSIPVNGDGSAGTPVVTTDPQFLFPDGIAIGADGRVYAALIAQSAIAALEPGTGELEYLATASDGLDFPSSLTFGEGALEADSLYAVNYAIGPPGAGPGLVRVGTGVAGAVVERPLVELPFLASFSGQVLGINEDASDIAARCSDRPAWAIVSFEGTGDMPGMGLTHVFAEHCSYVGPLPDGTMGPDGTYGEGVLILTAADGEVVMGTYAEGVSTSPPPDVGFADAFTFDGGTGRFSDATGRGMEMGTVDFSMGFGPGAPFSMTMEGVIAY
jgi:sugar lactone lactonase YvrE